MKKVELLSPVGSIDALKQAIHNGADAVYLAGKKYGARSYAPNFSNEELICAIKYCHLYGVKIYITVNTIIYDNEIDEFLDYIKFLYENNVDAIIMQDIGMIKKVRQDFPDLEIHASTQMHNHNIEGVKLLEKLGVKRIVFARELAIEQINNIETSLEKEVFVHGAICVCYSGCCLFSSMKHKRSGNRGECIASCRLKYKLLKNNEYVKTNGEYLLSTKELNTINNIDNLLKSGIDSLKIEGRMKSPEYVGFITRIYKEAIDSFYNGKKYYISNESLKQMMSLYNREYTSGYLFNEYGSKLMNIKTPNHQGYYIGDIIDINNKKIKIHLKEDLSQEDAIRFVNSNKGMIVNKLYNEKGLLVNSISNGNIAIIDNKIMLDKKDKINKTIDKKLIDSFSLINEKKIPVDIYVKAKKNEKLKVIIKDIDSNIVEEDGVIVLPSINRPVSKDDIKKQMRFGNSPFVLSNITIDLDDEIFISNKDLNEIRRSLTNKLIFIRENKKLKKEKNYFSLEDKTYIKEKNNLNVLVRKEEQLKACIDSCVDNIYVTDYKLYKEYKNTNINIYYVLPRVMNNYTLYKNENLLVRELGSVEKYSQTNNVISDYTLNVVNKHSTSLLSNLGVNRVCISPEVDIENIDKSIYNTEIVVYGRLELMVMKYCPVNMIVNKDIKKCNLCIKDKYFLEDEKHNKYPLIYENHLTTILDSNNIDLTNKLDVIRRKTNNIRINLYDEDYYKTLEIIKRFK